MKKLNPITNGTRHLKYTCSFNLTNKKQKCFTIGFFKNSGRNNLGRITVRHKRHTKQNYININFKYSKLKNLAVCVNLVKDLNRTAFVALIKYSNGSYSYILSPQFFNHGCFLQTIVVSERFSKKYNEGCVVLLYNLQRKSIFF